ncbi:MAG: hypothetical protein KIT31_40145 [Deltaproteobacteria bacterium]|nr:hypothetical protein [Deltaproteobacteria bacterium]
MKRQIENELRGERIVGVGAFQRVEGLGVAWATLAMNPGDASIHITPSGYVRAAATLVFDRVSVPLVVMLVPQLTADRLDFAVYAQANLSFDNGVVQWLNDRLGGNKLATRFARRQLDANLVSALAPPPPFELPGGATLQFGYCAGAVEVADHAWGALPFSVVIGGTDPATLPPRRGPAQHPPVAPGVAVAIDIDLDGLNALLYELWRAKLLDRRLAEAGLDTRFNEDPLVAEMLTLRLAPPRLALPPVLSPSQHGLALHADARVAIRDGETTTTGRVWGGLAFSFVAPLAPVAVSLGELELTCERTPTALVPCFADLVAALRERGDQFHGELTRTFGKLLEEVFVDRRVSGPGLPMELVIKRAAPSVMVAAGNASLRLDLDAGLAPRTP